MSAPAPRASGVGPRPRETWPNTGPTVLPPISMPPALARRQSARTVRSVRAKAWRSTIPTCMRSWTRRWLTRIVLTGAGHARIARSGDTIVLAPPIPNDYHTRPLPGGHMRSLGTSLIRSARGVLLGVGVALVALSFRGDVA